MDLEDFIKTTLVGIYKGIKSSNQELSNSTFSIQAEDKNIIEYDVALSVGSQDMKTGSGKLHVYIAQVGADSTASNSTQTVSRVKFKVRSSWIQ